MLAHNLYLCQRTQDVKITEDVNFDTMLLSCDTLVGLKTTGFVKPSPIQLHGIPLGKCGFDLLLEAKSGTGKTAVFTVIALEKYDSTLGLQTVILAPTREIASQISDVIKQIGSNYQNLNVVVVMGGLPLQDDIKKFDKTVHILVGSPGRVKHLIQDKYIDTSGVKLLVLDEADKLMEKSFITDIDFIFNSLPKQKQVIMSSATYPESSKSFIYKYVKNAQHICPDSNSILLGIVQKITIVNYNTNIVRQTQIRFQELLKIITQKPFKQCLVFCNYQARVSEVHKLLLREKWPAEQLYGQQEQTDRLDALKTLQEYKCRILISTDLAARGIDASNVDLVINFEPPFEWQTYLHRIGRAGRFGAYGIAITILSEGQEEAKFKTMLEKLKSPLNISYLWKDKKLAVGNLSNGDTIATLGPIYQEPLEGGIKVTKTYTDKIWQLLTANERKENCSETFENLLHSFTQVNTSVSKTETFKELLDSFSNQENVLDDSSSYQTVKIPEIPIKELYVYTQSIQQGNSCNTTNNTKALEIVAEEKTDKNENITVNVTSPTPSQTLDNKDFSCESLSKIDSNILQEAGLPTEFSGKRNYSVKRYKKKSDSDIVSNNLISNHQDDVLLQTEFQLQADKNKRTQNIPKRFETNLYRQNINQTDQKDYNERTSFSSDSNCDNELDRCLLYKRNYKLNYNMKKVKQNNVNLNNVYMQWYKQLKYRTKQIEMAVYIDELSKLAIR